MPSINTVAKKVKVRLYICLLPDHVTFVDDMRACGFSKENSWQQVISRQITLVLQYLGIQAGCS
jgi:hypothetical protein